VVLNAAAALVVADVAETLEQGVTRAAAALDSGAALTKLDELAAFRG
jgi:anthranilate phosphoribosyltransferase